MTARERKKKSILPILLCIYLAFTACDPPYKKIDPASSFKKVYDKPLLYSYSAVDIKQTPGNGYIILGTCEGVPYLMKVDRWGDYLWDTGYEAFDQYGAPVPGILQGEDNPHDYFFFCNKMTENGQPVVLLKINAANNVPGEPDMIDFPDHLPGNRSILPMQGMLTFDNGILLLALDVSDNRVIFMKLDRDGSAAWLKSPEPQFSRICANTYHISDRRFHFIGSLPTEFPGTDLYYFHSYLDGGQYNYPQCFGVVAVDPANGDSLLEYPLPMAIIALESCGPQAFSGALFVEGLIVFFINRALPELNEDVLELRYELTPSRPVYVETINVNEQKVVFFSGSGRNGKIALYAYDWSSRQLIDRRYFGHTNLYESAGLIATADGGLALLGTTYMAGQLGRICIFKCSKQELENMVGQY